MTEMLFDLAVKLLNKYDLLGGILIVPCMVLTRRRTNINVNIHRKKASKRVRRLKKRQK